MSLAKPKNIEEKILVKLTSGTKTTSTLLDELRIAFPITKQGYYKALRALRNEESIVIYKKNVSLDPVWIRSNLKILTTASDKYFVANENQSIILPESGEEVAYTFSNIKNLDTFWGHTQSAIIKTTLTTEPVYSYDPHYWLFIARQQRETELLEELVELKRQFLMTVGHKTEIDKKIKIYFNNDYLQYNFNKLFEKNNFYMTIVGNYLIEVTLDIKICNIIEHIFETETQVNELLKKKLEELLNEKSKNKIKISNNGKKVSKLKHRFEKDFYIIRKQG